MQQTRRQIKTGIVISKAGTKTVIVKVDTMVAHPLYRKKIRTTKRFAAHDQNDSVKVGDTVLIGETRPLSKTKHWEVINVEKSSSSEVEI